MILINLLERLYSIWKVCPFFHFHDFRRFPFQGIRWLSDHKLVVTSKYVIQWGMRILVIMHLCTLSLISCGGICLPALTFHYPEQFPGMRQIYLSLYPREKRGKWSHTYNPNTCRRCPVQFVNTLDSNITILAIFRVTQITLSLLLHFVSHIFIILLYFYYTFSLFYMTYFYIQLRN